MTPKQAAKQHLLYQKLVAGVKVKPSEYPAWQRNAGKGWEWKPADEMRCESIMRAEYEANMRATHGEDWDPNPAAINWEAYAALERGERCEVCGRPGLKSCEPCEAWARARYDAKRIRKAVAA